MLAVVTPRDLEASSQAHEVLDGVEVAVQARSIAGLAFGNSDDQAARPFDRSTGATALVIGGRHHRKYFPRRDLFDSAGRNAMRIEVLRLVALQLVEAGNALFHRLGAE